MRKTITIGGLHGTGKSSLADRMAKHFKLRRVSAGVIFRGLAKERGMSLEEFSKFAEGNEEIDRELDARQKIEAEKGNLVMDGQLAAWMAGEYSDFNILLLASLEERVRRISDRDCTDYDYANNETVVREKSERERYKEYYAIDVADLSIYDLIINTDKFDLDGVVAIAVAAVTALLNQPQAEG
jgi:cytidylate kinase